MLELFTGQKNQVFTAGDSTTQYDVLVGSLTVIRKLSFVDM